MIEYRGTTSSIPEEKHYRFRLLGTGAADPTVEVGPASVRVTLTATGVYKIAWPIVDGPGNFIGFVGAPMFGAATPADVKGQTCTRSTYTAPTETAGGFLSISVWSSTFAADNLQATEYLDFTIAFSGNSEIG
jgi:hypothetical protein